MKGHALDSSTRVPSSTPRGPTGTMATMTVPQITAVRLGGSPGLPLLVLGPALGTSARALWGPAARLLSDRFEVLAWDLPGHGSNLLVAKPFTLAELAAGVLALVDDMTAERGELDTSFDYAGVSVGGGVGLHLLLDAPQRVRSAVLISTGATIGSVDGWRDRAATVRASGTAAVVEGSAGRWFADGFPEREPAAAEALISALRGANDEGYAQVCEALAGHDVRNRLDRIRTPVLAVAGAEDTVTPAASLQEIADGVVGATFVEVDGVAHLPPVEQPQVVADLVAAHVAGDPIRVGPVAEPSDVMRRNVVEVFAQTSRADRDAVMDELYDPAVVFEDGESRVDGLAALKDHVDDLLGRLTGLTFTVAGCADAVGDLGRVDWLLGPAGGEPVASGTDVGLVRDGRLVRLWTFLDG